MTVRSLGFDDVTEYLQHLNFTNSESGRDGRGHSHAYNAGDTIDVDEAYEREVVRWQTPLDDVGWRRAWGLFDQTLLVGHVHLVGGQLPSELHRVSMGMGLRRTHHRHGGGTRLLEAALAWASSQPGIDWIDLGVFSDNTAAQALYTRHNFEIVGRTSDRFRVDGVSLGDISMTINVASGA